MSDSAVFGFLNIDKPLGMTSHDVVTQVRRQLGVRKVGHAGTLDPLATGVLIICMGAATRLSEYVMHAQKRYTAGVLFGQTTTTYDAEGEIITEADASSLSREDVEKVLPRFIGTFLQTPPIYSAIKVGGRKLYDIARAGETIALQPRTVHIDSITLLDWQPPLAILDVQCSAGTYIRSLAYDLGQALEVGAHLTSLRRTQSGSFHINQAYTPDMLFTRPDWRTQLIQPDQALASWHRFTLGVDQVEVMSHGGAVPHQGAQEQQLALAYTEAGELLAVVRAEGGLWVPQKVFWKKI